MRVPLAWLAEYVDVPVAPEALAERLSMTGTKVEAIHRRGVPAGNGGDAGVEAGALYRVGRVVDFEQHPNADRLRLCRVDVGEAEPRQIVCGASNFERGDTVAVVLPGALLPTGDVLRRARLRGVESDGMMLSERELELSADHEGIMRLPGTWPVGAPLARYLPISDTVLELEITPNRPDCMCVFGVAREASAMLDRDLAPWPGREPRALGDGHVDDYVRARLDAPDLCPRWAGRVFTDVRVGPSPPWLKARIAAAGMRPISNVVDVTNYVMLCIGEPTHAFDLDRVAGREIIVRRAGEGEEVVTLDGQRRVLDREVLVIADAEKPSAIAGLMGAEWSEVHDGTSSVLLECANFDGPATQRASMRLGLRTEGSARWEKGLDPHLVPRALALASELMVEVCGARLVPGTIDLHGELPEPPVVPLRRERLERLIGARYADEECGRILTRLGYEPAAGGWRVPTWRAADTTREVDLIEEVARIAGLERVPAELPPRERAIGRLTDEQRLRRHVVDVLLGAGLTEAITIPMLDEALLERLRLAPDDPRRAPVRLANPMGADQAALRTTILPGLLGAVRRNLAVGAGRVALFELGTVFLAGDGDLPDQPLRAGAVMAGEGADYFAIKGVLETLLRALRQTAETPPATEPFLHPGRSARVCAAGWIGELHPLVAEAWDIEAPAAAFEVDLATLFARMPGTPVYRDVTSFPPLRQDIAVIVADETAAGDVLAAVREAGGPTLVDAGVFDVYRGPQVGEGRKSLAVRLVFQAPDRTLTDAEAATARERIVAVLGERFGGELRG
jgi:phenylalanyl-tRNA synthetase beta chain